jgi:hypothetical protein
MNPILRTSLVPCALALVLTACGGAQSGDPEVPPAASASAAPAAGSAAASAASVPSAAPKAEPPADPVRAAAAKVLACPDWDGSGMPWSCDAFTAWSELPALEDGKGDATLVAMLDDADPKLQALAARGLRSSGRTYRADTAMAEKVVAKLEAGKGETGLLEDLAQAAGAVDAEKTKLGPRLLELAKKIATPSVRANLISSGQFHNSDLFYPVTSELAKSATDDELRRAAISSFWVGTPNAKHDEVCALWVSIAQDAKTPEGLAAQSLDYAGWNPSPCDKQYETIVKVLEKRLKGPVEESSWVFAANHLSNQGKLAAPLKKKLVALLKGVANDPKSRSSARMYAIDGAVKGDPAGAKAFLGKLSKDKNEEVKKHAAEAMTKKD